MPSSNQEMRQSKRPVGIRITAFRDPVQILHISGKGFKGQAGYILFSARVTYTCPVCRWKGSTEDLDHAEDFDPPEETDNFMPPICPECAVGFPKDYQPLRSAIILHMWIEQHLRRKGYCRTGLEALSRIADVIQGEGITLDATMLFPACGFSRVKGNVWQWVKS